MATVSFRVPDDLKARMDEHPEVNWSAVLREQIARELDELGERNLARAVLVSEHLSAAVDPAAAEEADVAGAVREWRDRRYGPGSQEAGGGGTADGEDGDA